METDTGSAKTKRKLSPTAELREITKTAKTTNSNPNSSNKTRPEDIFMPTYAKPEIKNNQQNTINPISVNDTATLSDTYSEEDSEEEQEFQYLLCNTLLGDNYDEHTAA